MSSFSNSGNFRQFVFENANQSPLIEMDGFPGLVFSYTSSSLDGSLKKTAVAMATKQWRPPRGPLLSESSSGMRKTWTKTTEPSRRIGRETRRRLTGKRRRGVWTSCFGESTGHRSFISTQRTSPFQHQPLFGRSSATMTSTVAVLEITGFPFHCFCFLGFLGSYEVLEGHFVV